MDVGMELKVLAPGVQRRQYADLGSQVLGIGSQLEQGFRGGPHQQAVNPSGILKCDWTEDPWKRKNYVKVRRRQQVSRLRLQPPRRRCTLALGTVAVAAGVVSDLTMPALPALQDVPTQGCSTARGQIVKSPPLLRGESVAEPFQVLVVTTPDDLGHFEPRRRHG
jgi:hypothetical protein